MVRDVSLDTLLALDGTFLVIDPAGPHFVQFVVRRVPATPARPHGLDYSLTLHGPDGGRLVGYDNAHSVRTSSGPAGRGSVERDHRHRGDGVRPYRYTNAETLLADFWADVDFVLKQRGVLP